MEKHRTIEELKAEIEKYNVKREEIIEKYKKSDDEYKTKEELRSEIEELKAIELHFTKEELLLLNEHDKDFYIENGVLYHDMDKIPFDYWNGNHNIHATGREYYDEKDQVWRNEYEDDLDYDKDDDYEY